jgi:hypothetical protein
VKTPEQVLQVREAFEQSRYFVGIAMQAWLVEVLPSRGLFVPAISFLDMADRKADNFVAVPGWYV